MDDKRSFVLYTSYLRQVSQLSLEDAGALFLGILRHAAGEDPQLTGAASICFSFISDQMDRDAAKWEDTKAARAEAGRKGGLSRASKAKQSQANASNAKQSQANQAVDVDVDVNDNVDVDVNKGRVKPFKKRETHSSYIGNSESTADIERMLLDRREV